jgi:uncharacterized SAM-binding protein YcdF (DUF218 family)
LELILTNAIEVMVLPPGIFFVLLIPGLLLLNRKPAVARGLLWSGLVILYLSSAPQISGFLIEQLEIYPALGVKDIQQHKAGAIVILASEREKDAKEYDNDTVGVNTLLRTRYGAFLQRKTGLPILVTGGLVFDKEGKSLAQTMAESLTEDFGAGTIWLEDKSRTTAQNAFFSKKLLSQKQIDRVFLVTQAWHMPRAVAIFEKAGLNVIPAPTAFKSGQPFEVSGLLPGADSINTSRLALHEMLGLLWYRIRY